MPRYRELKNNYTSGELDPRMLGRADNKHYVNGAEFMRNVIALPQGGFKLRPGLAYAAEVPDNAGGTPSDTRLISHVFNAEQRYLVMLVDAGYQIFKGGVLQANEVGETWSDDELGDISWTQNRDTLLIFHVDHRPRAIQRQGDDVTWDAFDWTLNNIPRFAFGDTVYVNGVDEVQNLSFSGANWAIGDPFTLTVGGEETDPISYHSTSATLATNIETALRALSWTSAAGITVTGAALTTIVVTFGGDEGDKPIGSIVPVIKATGGAGAARYVNVTLTTKGVYPGEDTWSVTRGWPGCGQFYQGRLFLAGSSQRPDTVWASRSGDEEDFNNEQTADDYGFDVTANAEEVPFFKQIFAGRHLQCFSTSAEFYVPLSADEGITPLNFVLRQTTARGIKAGMPVFDVEGATVFIQAEKETDTIGYRRGVAVREFIFADGEQAYQANDISLLSSHLIRDPRRVAVKRTASANNCDYVLTPNEDDGTMTWFCTLRNQEINAFTLSETDGTFLDVAVDGDDIYAVVERSIGGVTRRFLERHVEGLYVDCGVYEFDLTAPVSSVSCAHLEGETVQVRVDGNWRADVVVSGGSVTLDPPAASEYQVGLAWPIVDAERGSVWKVGDLPIAAELADGPITGRKRRTVQVVVDLLDTQTLRVNGNRITGRRFGPALLDQETPRINGERRVPGLLGWDNRGRVTYEDTRPGPMTVRAATKAVGV